MKKDGRVESIRELWSDRQEQNDNKLIREQDAYRAKIAQFKRDKGRLFTALYKCMSKEVKDLVRLQETSYIEAEKDLNPLGLLKIMKDVTERSTTAKIDTT